MSWTTSVMNSCKQNGHNFIQVYKQVCSYKAAEEFSATLLQRRIPAANHTADSANQRASINIQTEKLEKWPNGFARKLKDNDRTKDV